MAVLCQARDQRPLLLGGREPGIRPEDMTEFTSCIGPAVIIDKLRHQEDRDKE